MLVRFTSEAGPDIVMFEADAALMLRLMNLSGKIPSAILADDIEEALRNFQGAVLSDSEFEESESTAGNTLEEDEEPVNFMTRAYPLIQLLKVAQSREAAVMWNYNKGTYI
ncbi:MAG: DUF1840 domain-containing protein [Gammaproteobacteria bacterium]|nr:DUF1840 domain-containing protein [Gammaproteobacteria bacterium]